MSKYRLLTYLADGRTEVMVRKILDKYFYKLELEGLIEPYYAYDRLNEHFVYKQLTILGQELLAEESYLEYLGRLGFVVNKYKDSIVKIYHPSDAGIGTGFFISPSQIATARHVIEGLSEVEIAFETASHDAARFVLSLT